MTAGPAAARLSASAAARLCVCAAIVAFSPAPLLAQCADGTPPPCAGRGPRAAPPAPNSIAVLVLENLSRDTADAYLSDGLTEEITARLGDIERLRVTGRTATRRAQQLANGDFQQLGRALGVRYLVEGSIRRSGISVRVSVRLLRAADGVRVWGRTFDRTLTDILSLQEEIAREVATNVAGQLLPAERTRLATRPTTNPEAYVHYLRGSWLTGRRSAPGAFQGAAAEFDVALRLDPRFTGAMARRAYALIIGYAYGSTWAPPDSLAAWAVASSERAVRLDSTSSDAWMARGVVVTWVNHDFARARPMIERAIALDPRNVEAHHVLGVTLAWMGEDSAAGAALRRALALDPGRAVTLLDIAELAMLAGRPADALARLDSAILIDPEQARPYLVRARIESALGDGARARTHALAGLRLGTAGLRREALSVLAMVDAALGDTAAARRDAAALDSLGPSPVDRARALTALGERDSALTALERARPDVLSWWALRFPEFDALRADPRFRRVFEAWRPARTAGSSP